MAVWSGGTVIPAQEGHPSAGASSQPFYVIPAFIRHPSEGWDLTFKKWILAFASMTLGLNSLPLNSGK